MRILTFQRRKGSNRAGVLTGEGDILDLSRAFSSRIQPRTREAADTQALLQDLRGLSSSVLEIIRGGDIALTACYELKRDCDEGKFPDLVVPQEEVTLSAPIPAPPAVLHFEASFQHIQALSRITGGTQSPIPPYWFKYPQFFYGSPHLILGCDDQVQCPEDETMLDYELELAAVLGESVHNATIEDAEEAILGYTIANDWTARGAQVELPGSAKGKSIGTAIGPWIVTKDELADPYGLTTRVLVNGRQQGRGSTAGMHFSFAEMICYASEGAFLPAGTVILSGGLNGGSGLLNGGYLKPGDEVDLEVESIGSLRGRVHERPLTRTFKPNMADEHTD